MTEGTFKLAGREFRVVGQELPTIQDFYITGLLRNIGIFELLMLPQKSVEQEGEQIFTLILLSGRAHELIAAILVEDGKRWSVDEAKQNAEVFGGITDPDEKRLMQSALVGLVGSFFDSAGRLSPISPNSFAPHKTAADGASAAAETSETSG